MYYTIYKITNLLDGKFYVGKHKTKNLDDGYMGSGKLIRRAIEKHGVENFKKEILHVFQTEAEMNDAEARLVVLSEESYNLCPGGEGGFGYIHKHGLNRKASREELLSQLVTARCKLAQLRKDTDFKLKHSKNLSKSLKGRVSTFKGQHHSLEAKQAMAEKNAITQLGHRNSQYGTFWITDGCKNKKISKQDIIEEGWRRGRSFPSKTKTSL